MQKLYRVKEDNFLWKKGAILKPTSSGYAPDTDIWDTTEHNESEYISAKIIENNPNDFERVYEVNLLTKTVYKLKGEAQEMFAKEHKE